MFNSHVGRLDSFSRELMNKLCVKSDGLDDSLFMTMVALLYNRVKDLKLCYSITKNVEEINLDPDVFAIYWFEDISDPDNALKNIKKQVKSIEKLPTHEKFLSDQLKQPISIRLMPNENTACIFIKKVTYQIWHCVPFFLPKFFKIFKEKPLTKDETAFLETLTYKTSNNYITKLTELINKDSFRTYLTREQLDAFEKKLFERKVENAKQRLSVIEEIMTKAMQDYKEACNKRIEAMALVHGLVSMRDNTDEHTELQDYIMNNPRICNVTIKDSFIRFIVKTVFSPHHIEEWETMTKSHKTFEQYKACGDPDNIKLILDAIMSENRCLKLKLCAYFEMDYFGGSVSSQANYNYVETNPSLKDYIPNPHLQHHNCFGQNKTAILEQLKMGDAIGAFECAVACAQRINIFDMSFREFVPDLMKSTGKCLITEDGTEMTVKEAITYLKGKADE